MAPIVTANDFDRRFVFGVGSSAYQVEGAAKEGGRGESIWDVFARQSGHIKDGSNGDTAADQYHRYNDDLDLMAKLGFTAYHFSISWSRIFADGLGTTVNAAGVAYYDGLINAILKKKMTPYVTLFHWDLPNHLQTTTNGWLCSNIVARFTLYAEMCFTKFGDRVMHWITINDPLSVAINGFGTGIHAPGRKSNAEPYKVGYHLLLAHATVVSSYRTKFKHQGGEIGISLGCQWGEPDNWNRPEDIEAAKRHMDFQIGWYYIT